MSVSRPARCLLSKSSIPQIHPLRCRNFHASPNLSARRRPRAPSVKAKDMGLLFPKYGEEDKEALGRWYTPAQMKAIEAGEDAISPEVLAKQGVFRSDIAALPYFDDFSQLQTVLDKRPEREVPNDPKARFTTQDEFGSAFVKWLDKMKELEPKGLKRTDPDWAKKMRPNRADFFRMTHEINATVDSNGLQEPYPLSQFKPDIAPEGEEIVPTDEQREAAQKVVVEKKDPDNDETENDPRDPDGIFNKLRRQTGMELDEILDLKIKVLVTHRVVNQTRLGKISSMYCMAIAGNGKGRLGIGQAKGSEALDAGNLAKIAAIRNMQPIPRYEERTIFGETEAKQSAVVVKLMSRPPGFGLRCQHNIFEMARAAGIQDLAARVPRARNKMNTIKATFKALLGQRMPDDVARSRGKKLVDVRKVYYGGRV